MKSPTRAALLAVLLFAITAARGSSSLVLVDGQVIKGSEVIRRGDAYFVTMTGGNTVAFPAALVKEIKFEDDPPPPDPPGFVTTGPRNLAGPVIPAQDPGEALKALGTPTVWSKSPVDTTVVLEDAFDPKADVLKGSRSTWSKSAVDTTVVLKDAFDRKANVMARGETKWAESVVDTTWKPTDGFGFKPLSFPKASPDAATPAPAPWDCAEGFFVKNADRSPSEKGNQSPSLSVRSVKSPLYDSLGLPLYEANGTIGGAPRKAVFTIAEGACRLVGGDADAVIGLNLSPDHAMAQDAASLNVALSARGGSRVPPGVDKVDYALAFVSLTDPLVSGSKGAALKLLAKPEELRSIVLKTGGTCSLPKGKRRKEERAASKSFALPKITAGKDGDVVTFLTWSSVSGTVSRETVVLSRGGVVSAKREILASHVGDHKD